MNEVTIKKAKKKSTPTAEIAAQKPAEVIVEAEEEKITSKDWKNLLIVLGVIIILIAVSFGAVWGYNKYKAASVLSIDELHQKNLEGDLDPEEGYVYQGYSFVKADGLWWTELNKFGTRLKIPLHFGPKEVESFTIQGTLDPAFNDGDQLFIAIDPDVRDKYYTLALSELSFNVVKGLDREPIGSCTTENWACENRTIVSCLRNPLHKPVIELDLNETPQITLDGTCIKLSGSGYNLTMAVDRILYQWYGVME